MRQLTELTAHRIDMEKSTQGHNISTHIEIDFKKKPTTIIKVFVGHLLTHAHTMTNIRWYITTSIRFKESLLFLIMILYLPMKFYSKHSM